MFSQIHCDATVTTKDASHVSNRTHVHGTQSRWKAKQNIVVHTHDNLNIGSSSRFFYFLPHSASSLFKLLRHVESPIQVIHALLTTLIETQNLQRGTTKRGCSI